MSDSRKNEEPNIHQIIETESILCVFQSMVSLGKKRVSAVEALSRGIHPATGELISPAWLFSEAEKKGLSVKLDRLCRKKAMENFSALIKKKNIQTLLSMNFDTAILDQGVLGSNFILKSLRETGLEPHEVVIELIESRAENLQALKDFVATYKNHGFLIALDDIGAGHSNLDRIALLQPDIIKLDRYLVHEADQHYYKQEVIKALTSLAHKIGAVVVAEGIEREEDALFCLEHGADWIQGFYFSKPEAMPFSEIAQNSLAVKMDRLSDRFREYRMEKLTVRREKERRLETLISQLLLEFTHLMPGDFDQALNSMITRQAGLECAYILDSRGIQVTDTFCNQACFSPKKRMIFQPDQRGADQSSKEYFMRVKAGLERHTTAPYISAASGNLCRTVSEHFRSPEGEAFVLCLDVKESLIGESRDE